MERVSLPNRSKVVLLYLGLCLAGILIVMRWQIFLVLMVAHVGMGLYLLKDTAWLVRSIAKDINVAITTLIAMCFLAWCLVISIFHSEVVGVVPALKGLISNMFLNFFLGLYFGLAVAYSNHGFRKAIFSYYMRLIGLVSVFLLLLIISFPNFGGIALLRFDPEYQSFYQTVSAYLARLILVGVVLHSMLCAGEPNAKVSPSFIGCILFFALFSLLIGSKKEPVIFALVAVYLVSHLCIKHRRILFAGLLLFALVFKEGLNIFSSLGKVYLINVQHSIYSRLEIVYSEFFNQVALSGALGNPFVNEVLGVHYMHSFLLSLITATGVLGVSIFFVFLLFLSWGLFFQKWYGFLSLLVVFFGVSVVATFFDWMVIWFAFGLGVAMLARASNSRNMECSQKGAESSA